MEATSYGLVGDIGGTNARFALTDLAYPEPKVFAARNFLCEDYPSAEDAIRSYLATLDVAWRPRSAVLAVAGPVTAGEAALTNHVWRLSEEALSSRGFQTAKLINDYAALALAATDLAPHELRTIGRDLPGDAAQPIAVVGAGTGFGAAVVAKSEGRPTVLVTEAGHMGFSPCGELEREVARIIAGRFGRASVERLLSGPGLRNLYMAIAEIRGAPMKAPSAETITRLGLAGQDELCVETLDRFCSIYGAVVGDIALAMGARGGVYLAGGIAPKILPRLASGPFRERFESKGRLSGYVREIPTRVIVQGQTALIGAAKQLRRLQPLAIVGRGTRR